MTDLHRHHPKQENYKSQHTSRIGDKTRQGAGKCHDVVIDSHRTPLAQRLGVVAELLQVKFGKIG
jgi:hypothetical protein